MLKPNTFTNLRRDYSVLDLKKLEQFLVKLPNFTWDECKNISLNPNVTKAEYKPIDGCQGHYYYTLKNGKTYKVFQDSVGCVYDPFTLEEIKEMDGRFLDDGMFSFLLSSEFIERHEKIYTNSMGFCEKWQPESYQKFKIYLTNKETVTVYIN